MDYYKLRKYVFTEVYKYLTRAQEQRAESITEFTHKLKINHGVTDKLIIRGFAEYGLFLDMEEGTVVKIEKPTKGDNNSAIE